MVLPAGIVKEIKQLPKLLEPGERILECLNGWYENGLALLVATDRRVLLVDQKAFNFLKVESLELHEIDKVDHSHHIMGSRLTIKTQSAILHFRSMNRLRLRRLMDRLLGRLFELQQWQREQVEASHQHLQDVNKQLQDYAIAQHEQLQQALSGTPPAAMNPPKVDHKLADYLFAQQLLKSTARETRQRQLLPGPPWQLRPRQRMLLFRMFRTPLTVGLTTQIC